MTKKLLAPSAFVFVLVLAVYGCNSRQPGLPTTPIPAEDGHDDDAHSGHDHGDAHASHDAHEGHDHAPHDQSAKKSDMEKMTEALASFSPEDRASAMKQHVCPVSGETLGTMGAPEKVDVKGQPVWICCDGCKDKLLADPDKYLAEIAKLQALRMPHSQKDALEPHAQPLSDAVLIGLQGVCPVSGEKLGSMGAPPKVMVKGQPLFVCCAGCSSKVESSPDQYLAKFYGAKGEEVRPGVFKATLADSKAIAAQKACPVMDEPLGGMGTPIKVDVKGKAVFICCAGCAKKLDAEPDKYLQQLAKAGVTPPEMK